MRKSFILLCFFLLNHFGYSQHPLIGGYNVYYGSLHNHSNVSDGTGTPAAAYAYAKDVAKLDFFSLADHESYPLAGEISTAEWADMKSQADLNNIDGVFTTFTGFEWTTSTYGHVTVINSDDIALSTNTATDNLSKLGNWLSTRNCVAFFNHPGTYNSSGKEFDHFAGPVSTKFVGMELWNKQLPFSTYYYNDGYFRNDNDKSYYDEALNLGWKIGASGAHDHHGVNWGTSENSRMAILANNLSRNDLFSALKARRFYSTMDKNIALSFKINGQEMGSSIIPGTYSFQIQATDADISERFTEVVLFDKEHNTKQIWNINDAVIDVNATFNVVKGDYYYVKIKQADGDEAISSPIWIEVPVVALANMETVGVASNAIDNNTSTFWSTAWNKNNNPQPVWLQLDYTTSEIYNQVSLTFNITTSVGRAPQDFKIQGSNVGGVEGAWTDLSSQTAQSFLSGETKTYTFTNTTPYRYYRLYVSAVNTTTAIELSEISFRNFTPPPPPIKSTVNVNKLNSEPLIDGTLDAAWSSFSVNSIDKLEGGTTRTPNADYEASYRIGWINNKLFFFFDLKDNTLIFNRTGNGYGIQDNINIYLNFNPTNTNFGGNAGAHQYRFNFKNDGGVEKLDGRAGGTWNPSFGTNTLVTKASTGGYTAEVMMDLTTGWGATALANGITFNMDIEAADNDNSINVSNKVFWSKDGNGNNYDNVTGYGVATIVETQVIDSEQPTTPNGLSFASIGSNRFILNWSIPSTDNVAVAGYEAYNGATLIGSSTGTLNSMLITGLSPNTTYNVTLKAKDAAGNKSNASTVLIVTTTNAPIITASNEAAGFPASNAIDGLTSTNWKATPGPTVNAPHWLQIQYPSPQTFNKVILTSSAYNNGEGYSSRDPRNWTIEGSNDASLWTILDTRTFSTANPAYCWAIKDNETQHEVSKPFNFTNTTSYAYYRIKITDSNQSASSLMLSEIEFISEITETERNAISNRNIYSHEGRVIIDLRNSQINSSVKIFDSKGINIKSFKSNGEILKIEIRNKGIYLVQVQNALETYIQKLIIK